MGKEPQKDFQKPFEETKLPKEEKQGSLPKEESHKDFPKEEKHKELPKSDAAGEKQIAPHEHLKIAESKAKDLEDMLKRVQAEFENYQKRTQKEYIERFDLGKMDFAKSMLLFADEFENALKHVKGEERKGVEMIYKSFKKSLEGQGIRPMESIGKRFDPYLHDVIKQEASEKEEGIIIAELAKGYYFKDKVLRHASVIISKKKEDEDPKNPGVCDVCG
jgi:molecular chaperone GrpE